MKHILLIFISLFSISLLANDTLTVQDDEMSDERMIFLVDSINQSFVWQHGAIQIGDDMATLQIPSGYKYLDPVQSAYVMTDLYGNPPSESFGLLFKEDELPLDDNNSYFIEISFEEEGWIDDDDAEDIDYDELLEGIQESVDANNPHRAQMGYAQIVEISWASEPYYDVANKKLHWAKKILFEGDEVDNAYTLNYDVRILGRKGYMVMTAVGGIDQLSAFKADANNIVSAVNFNEGHRYEDFDPEYDKVAAYGIGGLIAGKALLKVGLLAKFGVLLAKFWKVILISIAAVGAGIKKFFGGGAGE